MTEKERELNRKIEEAERLKFERMEEVYQRKLHEAEERGRREGAEESRCLPS